MEPDSAAERLNGIELYVTRDKLPATSEDEYYHADLIGLAAVTPANAPLGRVVAIHNFRAGDIIGIPLRRRCTLRSGQIRRSTLASP